MLGFNTLHQAVVSIPKKWRTIWSVISKAVKIGLFVIGTAGFAAFIVEETMQVRGFGAYGLQQSKLWHEAAVYSNQCVDLLQRDKRTLRMLRWFNPVTGHIFMRYADAEEMKLQAQMTRIEFELKQLDKRMTLVEGKLKPTLIQVKKERDTKLPVNTPIAYPKQIDYETHAERVADVQSQVVSTKFGQKYHLKKCPSVAGKEVKVYESREDAEKAGLTPCRRCRP